MNKVLLFLSALVLVGCSNSLDLQLDPEVTVLLSHDRNQHIALTPQDKEYTSLNKWLRENRSGWHTTTGRYRGGVYLRSGDYGIQVTQTHVIIYSTDEDEPKAMYIQQIGHGELVEMRNMNKQR